MFSLNNLVCKYNNSTLEMKNQAHRCAVTWWEHIANKSNWNPGLSDTKAFALFYQIASQKAEYHKFTSQRDGKREGKTA